MQVGVDINHNILTWAIARAGYDLEEFSLKFPRIQDWLNETKKPTLKQLEEFAKKVYLPFGYLFLSEPPVERISIPFFRTNNNSVNISVNVYDTIILIQQRQEWLKEYLEENGYPVLPFVGRFKNRNNYLEIIADIKDTLGIEDGWASQFHTWQDALNYLTQVIEDIGIVIVFNGVVENNTSRPIKVDECRGFVLVDDTAPFMFVNNADAKAAQLFTIVHELAHIWTGHSAGFDFRKLQPANNEIELLCDKVAAEFLVPTELFIQVWRNNRGNLVLIAKYFKVSEIVAARRALDLGKLSRESFFSFYDAYISREIEKKKNKKGGGDFYSTTKKRLSMSFASHVNQAVKSGQLLYKDAYKLTSLKGDTFQNFFAENF